MDISPLFSHPMLLPEHSQKLAVAAFPRLVFSPGALGSLHLRLLVVLKGPLLAPAHVPALQKDLGSSTVVCADVHSELVVLQQTRGEDEEPPQVLRVQVAAAAVVVTTVQECLDGGERKCTLHNNGTWMTPLVGGKEGNMSSASGIIAPGIPSMEVDPTCSHLRPALSSGGTALSRSAPHFSTMLLICW